MEEEKENKHNFAAKVASLFVSSVRIPLFGVILLLIAGAGSAVYAVKSYPGFFGLPPSQNEIERETEKLVNDVGKLIALPEGENPVIATVTETDLLKGEPFFMKARNGDKVLIYTNAGKAILYRPSERRLIEVGSLNIGQEEILTENEEESDDELEPVQITLSPSPIPSPSSESE